MFCIPLKDASLLRQGRTFSVMQNSDDVAENYLLILPLSEALILYFFSYKTEFFSFQNHPKHLDPSYKMMDLDLWVCLGRVKLVL